MSSEVEDENISWTGGQQTNGPLDRLPLVTDEFFLSKPLFPVIQQLLVRINQVREEISLLDLLVGEFSFVDHFHEV